MRRLHAGAAEECRRAAELSTTASEAQRLLAAAAAAGDEFGATLDRLLLGPPAPAAARAQPLHLSQPLLPLLPLLPLAHSHVGRPAASGWDCLARGTATSWPGCQAPADSLLPGLT